MKVGVLQFFSWSRRVPLTAVYDRALARIEVMDQSGYDCVWLAEHHFNTYSVCPSINVMASHVAARTRHLRVGMRHASHSHRKQPRLKLAHGATPPRLRCDTPQPAPARTAGVSRPPRSRSL
jgi:hypothetical protein